MTRCLVMSERVVSQSDRAAYLLSLAVRRESAATASAHFWVFEDENVPGRFLEFVEAASAEVLARAVDATLARAATHGAAPAGALNAERVVWKEVTDVGK